MPPVPFATAKAAPRASAPQAPPMPMLSVRLPQATLDRLRLLETMVPKKASREVIREGIKDGVESALGRALTAGLAPAPQPVPKAPARARKAKAATPATETPGDADAAGEPLSPSAAAD